MLNNIKGVIFDLDGTLVDSMGVWKDVDIDFIDKYHLRKPDNLDRLIEGKSCLELAGYFLKWFPSLTMTKDEIVTEWKDMTLGKYKTEVLLKPGARALLEDLKKQDILLGIASSNSRDLIEIALEANNIKGYFDSIHSADEVAGGKPLPDVYLKVLEDFGLENDECLVFEDVPMGIMAGKNAGMNVCAIKDEYSLDLEDEKKELADYYIDTFHDINDGTFLRL